MAKFYCVICKKGRAEGRTLYRVNEAGVPGIWACGAHREQANAPKLDPIVEEIISIIEHAPRWNQPSVAKEKRKTLTSSSSLSKKSSKPTV